MTPAALRFDGRVSVVTGAGTGLGRSHALLLAARGAAVVVNDADGVAADAVVAEIEAAGGTAAACAESVATSEGAEAVVGTAVDGFGRLDAVVNNAGILRSCEVGAMTVDTWDEVLAVNLRGTFLVTRAAWPVMAAAGYGRVVSTTSNSGLLGTAGSSAYAAAKAGVWGLTRTLALEGADVGIRVNAVAPMAYTAMSAASRVAPPAWRSGEGDAWSDRLSPERVSPVVAWLAHETCPLNGEVLSAAGGRVARFFLGLTHGWDDVDPSVEDVAAHAEEILAVEGFEVLGRSADEGRHLHRQLLGGRPQSRRSGRSSA